MSVQSKILVFRRIKNWLYFIFIFLMNCVRWEHWFVAALFYLPFCRDVSAGVES